MLHTAHEVFSEVRYEQKRSGYRRRSAAYTEYLKRPAEFARQVPGLPANHETQACPMQNGGAAFAAWESTCPLLLVESDEGPVRRRGQVLSLPGEAAGGLHSVEFFRHRDECPRGTQRHFPGWSFAKSTFALVSFSW